MHMLISPSRVPLYTLDILLKQCYLARTCQKFALRRHYATTSPTTNHSPDSKHVAVLGGGITGLASAYYLARSLPNAQITLFESSSRLGGWLQSTQVDVGTGQVVFEQGPRNLRPSVPNGLVTLDLVRDLGMEDRIIMTDKKSLAAQNRFVYYPDHLVRMPGPGSSLLKNLSNIWSEPIFNGTISAALTEVSKPKRSEDLQDESVGSFISRRFGSALADNVVSAVFHGIYAGDIYKLSARTIIPGLWHNEGKHGSLIRGLLDQIFGGLRGVSSQDLDLLSLRTYENHPPESETMKQVKESSVFTFKNGIGELADRLEQDLLERPKVLIKRDTHVKRIKLNPNGICSKADIYTKTPANKSEDAIWEVDNIVSTIPGSKLAGLIQESTALLPLYQTKSVTVMVVNLFYANPKILPVHGFGYLLPRSIPFEQNPERALGVVFDSDASIGQDAVPGTKVTVMLGGHWWDDFDTYPDEEEGAAMAKMTLLRHLRIDEEPQAVRVGLQKSCIPQYEIGHDQRMAQVSKGLEKFDGQLRVAGNSYTGVGLNDCVRAARDVVKGFVDGTGKTGLESFVGGRKWSWIPPETLKN